jgi:FkbM family methyltransferase
MLALETDQYVTRSIALYGEYCPAEARILKQTITPGMTVVEVGANMGSHSVDMARACAPGPFYAFEPQPRLFQILCANLALNDIGNALAYPDACGEVEGEAMVPLVDYTQPGNFGGLSLGGTDGPGLAVRVRPLDTLNLAACGLLKIDVEGFEAQVIRGARGTILRCRPVIYIENDRADQQQELISLIAELGYRLYWHMPPLYDPANFNGETNNVFPGIVSLNMFCLPRETSSTVQGAQEIDPENWSSPVPLQR